MPYGQAHLVGLTAAGPVLNNGPIYGFNLARIGAARRLACNVLGRCMRRNAGRASIHIHLLYSQGNMAHAQRCLGNY